MTIRSTATILAALGMAGAGQAIYLTPNTYVSLPNGIPPLGTPLANMSQTINLIGFYDNLVYATVTVNSWVVQESATSLVFSYQFINHSISSEAVGGANIVPTGAFWKDGYSSLDNPLVPAVLAYDNLFGVQVRYGANVYGDPCIAPGQAGATFFFRTNAPSFTVGSAQVFGNNLFSQAFNYANVYVPVPEPATWLALAGSGLILTWRRHRSV